VYVGIQHAQTANLLQTDLAEISRLKCGTYNAILLKLQRN